MVKDGLYMYNWKQVHAYLGRAYGNIVEEEVDLIYGIPRGGVVPAIMLSHLTGIPVIISQSPPPMSSKTKILIIDDILDTGRTLKKCVDECKVFTDKIITLCMVVRSYNGDSETKVMGFPDYHHVVISDKDIWVLFPWENPANLNKDKENYEEKSI